MKRSTIVLLILSFFVLGCAQEQSPITPPPFVVFGYTDTPAPQVASPAPLLSDTVRVTYSTEANTVAPARFIMVAEYDMPGEDDVFLAQDLDIEGLKAAVAAKPVEGLAVLIQEGVTKTIKYTDGSGKLVVEITGLSVTSFYLPEWECTELSTWGRPGDEQNPPTRGGQFVCKKN